MAENEEKSKKTKKPIYKKWWFWVIIVIIIIALGNSSNNNDISTSSSNNTITTTTDYKTEDAVEVTVADFSSMTRDEIQAWFNDNKVNGKISDEYSDTIPKGNFIGQSVSANTIAHEGDVITVTYSLGKEPSIEEKNALKKAESYSSTMHMSKSKIYDQLTSEYGEAFTPEAAQYAIDNIQADWKANALAKAKSYQSTMNMSKQRIYEQLTSEYGEGFTSEEAQYAIDNLED